MNGTVVHCQCGAAYISREAWLKHVISKKKEEWSAHGEKIYSFQPETRVPEPSKTVEGPGYFKRLFAKPEIRLEKG